MNIKDPRGVVLELVNEKELQTLSACSHLTIFKTLVRDGKLPEAMLPSLVNELDMSGYPSIGSKILRLKGEIEITNEKPVNAAEAASKAKLDADTASLQARHKSELAMDASRQAIMSGKKEDHDAANQAHDMAEQAHLDAAKAQMGAGGDNDTTENHLRRACEDCQMGILHDNQAANCK